MISIGWWGVIYLLGVAYPPTTMDPVSWHGHEMVYGFACAVIGGFLLTAVANWTKRPPVAGLPLLLLTIAWICGRIAISLNTFIGPVVTALADLSYMVLLIILFGNEVIRAKDRRNYKVIALLILLCLFNLMFHFEYTFSLPIPPRLSIRGAIMVILLLIGTVGGRVLPNFTQNWLIKHKKESIAAPPAFGRLDLTVMVLTGVLAVGWTIDPHYKLVILGSFVIAALHAVRLSRWRGLSTVQDPLLLVLHVGYAWIPIGLLLSGWAALMEVIMHSAALHGLTIGAIGLTIIAMGSRVSLGHTSREMKAGKAMTLAYILIVISTVLRIFAGFPEFYVVGLTASIICWCLAFFIFLLRYYPILTQPRL